VTLFIEPRIKDVLISKHLGADCVELHTGKYCNLFNKKKKTKNAFNEIKKAAWFATNIGLEVHAGHGLTYNSTKRITKIKYISEFNIGHYIVSESLFSSFEKCIKNFLKIIK
jgi:pyridoxine 5-phosphate synthase